MLNYLFNIRDNLLNFSFPKSLKMRHSHKLNKLNDRYFQKTLSLRETVFTSALWTVLIYIVSVFPSGVLINVVVYWEVIITYN